MNILITTPQGNIFNRYFPNHVLQQIEALGNVSLNPYERNFTTDELKAALADQDIVITHWGTPQITEDLLKCAPRLKLMAHGTGTVAHIASEAFYERGIPVLSANSIMAEYVAEAVIGYLISAGHRMRQFDQLTREDRWEDKPKIKPQVSLLGADVGIIGLGTIARKLLPLLEPFRCKVHVYDPFAKPDALKQWKFAEFCSFEKAMSQPFVSIHASQTPETYHMVDREALKLMSDGGILINSARGSLVDTEALIAELKTGRIYAVLDVYEKEGTGKVPAELLALKENTLLQPHVACSPLTWEMTQGIVEDIQRFLNNEPLKLQISLQQYRLMTQE